MQSCSHGCDSKKILFHLPGFAVSELGVSPANRKPRVPLCATDVPDLLAQGHSLDDCRSARILSASHLLSFLCATSVSNFCQKLTAQIDFILYSKKIKTKTKSKNGWVFSGAISGEKKIAPTPLRVENIFSMVVYEWIRIEARMT